ncbi:trifunctional serine/threonine-protein kinase/ATP-binding protein/sensor histidine kinase [Burkholderia pyrrocinia]|uniref:trifunctional serine/threonine-protein kinase/ATP-binding protein/sensor histidine kinase n=1 Tax=Burkholderia pyrrocinia TaxID=60550 RepID=UPI001042B33E|nr:AAA family ATPase [Burkholderia pyrrocinia]TDA42325.1 GAF domain-containing protein [Burkholderia pyrrocinia]
MNADWLARARVSNAVRSGDVLWFDLTDTMTGRVWSACQTGWESDQRCRQFEHEYALNEALEPAWALMPVALIRAADGPVLVYPRPDVRGFDTQADGRLPLDAFLDAAIQATRTLGELHRRGWLHGDLQPASFAIAPDGTVMLRSFAHAWNRRTERAAAGTMRTEFAAYAAPEVSEGACVDERADLYAFGITLFRLLTGAMPYKATSTPEWVHAHVAMQPAPATAFRDDLPAILNDLILKLIAKEPADRYPSCEAVQHDLERIRRDWLAAGRVEPFALGGRDPLAGLHAPDLLVGREAESRRLEEVLAAVSQTGEAAIVLIDGPAGVGKTALAEHFMRAARAASRTAWCTSAKIDQFQPARPYAPVLQALRTLFGSALARRDDEIAAIAARLRDCVGRQANLLSGIFPEIAWLLDVEPVAFDDTYAIPEFPLCQIVVNAFRAFATPAEPLVIALDDIQWADDATLALLASIAADPPANICVVAGYRSGPQHDHPPAFRRFLRQLDPTRLSTLTLAPLAAPDVTRMLAGMLGEPPDRLSGLGDIVHRRTGGNPFHIQQLLRTLIDERLLGYDPARQTWQWDAAGIDARRPTENVVSLLEIRMQRLPHESRTLLSLLACVGSDADDALLCAAAGKTWAELRFWLDPARQAGLVSLSGNRWRFVHDRILEAVYAVTGPAERALRHARIAAAMLARADARSTESLLELAAQIEQAKTAPLDGALALEFADALAAAAEAAAIVAARDRALSFLATAQALLGPHAWSQHYDLASRIGILRSGLLLATGETAQASDAIDELMARTRTPADRAEAHRLKAAQLTVESHYRQAVDVALAGLALLGVELPAEPAEADLAAACDAVRDALDGRAIRDLVDLPVMTDTRVEATMALLTALEAAMFYPSGGLMLLHLATMVRLTLRHGVTAASVQGLAWYGVSIAEHHDAYEDGLEFAKVALALVDRHGFERYRSAALIALDQVSVWTQPLSYALERARDAKAAGNASAELRWMCYSCNHIVSDLLAMGEALPTIRDEIDPLLQIARGARYDDIVDLVSTQSEFVDALQFGYHRPIGTWRARASTKTPMSVLQFWTDVLAGQAAFIFGDADAARAALDAAASSAWSTPAHIMLSDFHLFGVLAGIASDRGATPPERLLERHAPQRARFAAWSKRNPATFRNKLALIDAEFARVRGEHIVAMQQYEASASLAAEHGFVHEQALAHELAAHHATSLGLAGSARHQLRLAHACYRRWGAAGKTQALEAQHPFLVMDPSPGGPPMPAREDLDFSLAMRAAHSLSEEIVLERLIQTLMRNMIVYAGARYGLLLLARHDRLTIEAAARTVGSDVIVDIARSEPTEQDVPLSILNTVARTRKPVVLANAQREGVPDHADSLRAHPTRSLFCLPLLKQGVLIGVLYLENALSNGVFSPRRIAMLEVLAPQAANALESARLYAELIDENTRRLETEAALRHARTELARTAHMTVMGELAASIAHEINQPLTSIVSSVGACMRWLRGAQPDLGEALASLEDIRASGVRAADIVRALRSLARQAPPALAPLAIDDLIRDMLHLTATEIDAKQVALRVDLHCGNIRVMADRTQIQQVILNLVTNALDAMDGLATSRELEIASQVGDAYAVVSVADRGAGIDDDIAKRILDPFFTTKSHGMGMGLAICRSIVEAHGGTLEAAPRDDSGTVLTFRLPISTTS